MLRVCPEGRAAGFNPKLEKLPSFSGNAFVVGFALALAGKEGKEEYRYGQVTPPLGCLYLSASSSSSLTTRTAGGAVAELTWLRRRNLVDEDPFGEHEGESRRRFVWR